MKYKLYFDALLCDRACSNFMKMFDDSIKGVGIETSVSFTIEEEPTDEVINKIIAYIEKTKDEKSLKGYLINVKINRIEIVK